MSKIREKENGERNNPDGKIAELFLVSFWCRRFSWVIKAINDTNMTHGLEKYDKICLKL